MIDRSKTYSINSLLKIQNLKKIILISIMISIAMPQVTCTTYKTVAAEPEVASAPEPPATVVTDPALDTKNYFGDSYQANNKAADEGHAAAQFKIGSMFAEGDGVKQDYSEAVSWYRKAADQGHADGQAKLGEMYEYGNGVHADYLEAINWYRKAADQGHEVSKTAVKRLSRGVWGVYNLQQLLAKQGYDPGVIDGVFGDQTLNAARNYLNTNDLKIDVNNITAIHNHLSEQTSTRSPSQASLYAASSGKNRIDLGTYHAFVIGIAEYKHLTKLDTATNDAQAVAELLRNQYGFQVTELHNATRSEIFSFLGRLRRELKPEDNLLIYYAGHGEIDKATERGYWLPVDAERNNRANWIPNEDITNDLSAMRAKHVLVIADSCYSGTLTRSAGTASMKQGGEMEWVSRMAQRRSRTALTSGGLEPVLDAGGGIHSVFANSFLKTLRENRKVIDMDSLYETVRRRVVLNARQTPKYKDIRFCGHDDGDFVWDPR